MQIKAIACAGIIAAGIAMIRVAAASPEEDRRAVAALDTEFQAAVKHTMPRPSTASSTRT